MTDKHIGIWQRLTTGFVLGAFLCTSSPAGAADYASLGATPRALIPLEWLAGTAYAATPLSTERDLPEASSLPVLLPGAPIVEPTISSESIAKALEDIAATVRRARPTGAAAPNAAQLSTATGDRDVLKLVTDIDTQVEQLGDFESTIIAEWNDEIIQMGRQGLDNVLAQRQAALLTEFRKRASEFRAYVAAVKSARAAGSRADAAKAVVDLSDWFSKQQNMRGFAAIDTTRLPFALAQANTAPEPVVQGAAASAKAISAEFDPPTAADSAQNLEVQFTPEIQALAAQLGNNPVRIRNWVYNNIEFDPTHGSIQGAALTLLNRHGNATDIASLTIAILRAAGVPARYAYGTAELPIDQVRNWLGNIPTANMAVDLMQKGQIPAVGLLSGGQVRAVRFEHTWVEAYVDFQPSRGAVNRTPDQWIPLDASFKQFEYQAPLPWKASTDAGLRSAAVNFAQGVSVGADGAISGFNYEALGDSLQQVARSTASQIVASTPDATPARMFQTRTIVPVERVMLEGTLPYPLVSNITRFSEVPTARRHVLHVAFYADETSVRYESPTREIDIPLARIGTQRLWVDNVPASAADAQAIANAEASNASSLAVGSLNVIPTLRLGTQPVMQSDGARMGTQQFWTTDLRDSHGSQTRTEAYKFAAGSNIVFQVNAAGVLPDRAERETANLPDHAYLPIQDALYYGGLIFWMMHDRVDREAAEYVGGRALRMPSVGAFAAPLQVRYFFGLPRTGFYKGHVTDAKAVRLAVATPNPADEKNVALHAGAGGSLAESISWNLLAGAPITNPGLSASSIIYTAIDQGQPLFQIDQNNYTQRLAAMQLSADAESEIANAAAAGMIIIAHKSEIQNRGWSGSGYVILDPNSGAALHRVEGGLAGGIDVGCIAKAVLLKALCESKIAKKAMAFLARLIARTGIAAMAEAAMIALLGPAGAAIGGVIAIVAVAVSYAMAVYEVYTWVRMIMDGIETLSQEDLAELGISALNDVVCSYAPPCFGGSGPPGGGGGGDGGGAGGGGGGPMMGNPFAVGTGAKWQTENDFEGIGPFPLRFERQYSSALPRAGGYVGAKWSATYFMQLRLPPSVEGNTFPETERPNAVLLVRPEGSWFQFSWNGSSYVGDSNLPGKLTRLVSGDTTTGWEFLNVYDEKETYNAQGRLLSITNRAGLTQTLNYDPLGRLTSVSDEFGRSLTFTYDPSTGYLATMTDPLSRVTSYTHDYNGNLVEVAYPDGRKRVYLYEDLVNRFHLTGITDERNVRVSTWRYDANGRVKYAERAGGVERFTLSYDKMMTTVTDPLGKVRTYRYVLKNDRSYLASVSEPCAVCGGGTASDTTYDGNGYLASVKDYRGYVTTYQRDSRGLETSRTEAFGTPSARTTTTTWHPQYRLPTKIVEPITGGTRTIDFTYDAQGNLRTRKVTVGANVRLWTFTYNDDGQVLTEDGPRTDVNDVVTYTYDAAGNRETMTDALNHVTRYTQYDAGGRLIAEVDANGLETSYVYDERDRVTQVRKGREGGATREIMEMTFDEAGNLTRATEPGGEFEAYTFDDAGRQVTRRDITGDHETLGYDDQGNRTTLEIAKSGGEVVLRSVDDYDDLGRLETTTGADGQVTSYEYDADGNEKRIVDPLLHDQRADYDELSRVTHYYDAVNGDTSFLYDPQDQVTEVKDARGVITRYVYTGFGQVEQLQSADTGTTMHVYDDNGNLRRRTDARNAVLDMTYDAADRLSTVTGADEQVTYVYDETGAGDGAKGHVTSILSAARGGSSEIVANGVSLTYDIHGRVLTRTQTIGATPTAATTRTVSWNYADNGRLNTLTLPTGHVLSYSYGLDGRVSGIGVNGQSVVREITYFPLSSEVASWKYGSGAEGYTRTYDLDGQVTSYTAAGVARTLSYDDASRVTGLVDNVSPSWSNWTFGYDELDRLTDATNAATLGASANAYLRWTYDATGNRRTEFAGSGQLPADPTTTYTIAPTSNRLQSIAGGVADTRQYDAAGNTTRWIARGGALAGATLDGVYSARGRLVLIRQGATPVARFAYNGAGERIGKWVGANAASITSAPSRQFVYDNQGHLLGEYDGTGAPIAEYAWLNDVPVAVLKPVSAGLGGQVAGAAEVFFVQPDHLDAPRALVNDQAQVVWRWDAKPFGDTSPDQQPTVGLPSFEFNLRLPGQYADVELGQYYNYTRDYEPTTGRYLQSDSIGIEDDYATYTYVGDDPVGSVDPTGMGRCPKALRALGLCKKRPPKPKRPEIKPPVGGGIYIIRDCKDNIVYIGQTNNFGKRMNKHWGSGGQLSGFNSPCCPVKVEFRIEPVGPGLDRMERNLIRRHRPPGNTQHNPNPKPYTPPCCK